MVRPARIELAAPRLGGEESCCNRLYSRDISAMRLDDPSGNKSSRVRPTPTDELVTRQVFSRAETNRAIVWLHPQRWNEGF